MKKIEIAISETGVKVTRENDNDLTEDHKFILWVSILAILAFLGFFSMIT